MPLASSRSAAQKRSESVAAERKEQQRRQRLSLPSTIASTTSVNKDKVKRRLSARHRRLSSSSQSKGSMQLPTKENHVPNRQMLPPKSPGVTPYWKTKEEGEALSPRLTRSQVKLAKTTEQQQADGSAGMMVLNFSPPDQQENERRAEQDAAADEAEHQRRVRQARANGRLLVFSPTHRDYVPPATHEFGGSPSHSLSQQSGASLMGHEVHRSDSSKDTSALTEEETSKQPTAVLSVQQNDEVANELKLVKETMDKLLKAQELAQGSDSTRLQEADRLLMQAQQLRTQTLAAANTKLEATKETLETRVGDLETKLTTDKEAYLVETTRLQSQLEAASNESVLRLSALQETRERIETQVETLQQDKLGLVQKVTELEQQVATTKAQLDESKATLQALRQESVSEQQALQSNQENLQHVNVGLSSELQAIQSTRDELERKIDEYQVTIHVLENQTLPASENKLADATSKLQSQQTSLEQLQQELTEYKTIVQELQNEIVELNREREEERESFQQLNEDSSKTYETLLQESSVKGERIAELSKQLDQVQQEVLDEQKTCKETAESLCNVQADMKTSVDQLNEALEDTMIQLEQAEQDKKNLEVKLANALRQMEDVAAAKAVALSKNTEASSALEDLQGSLSSERSAREEIERAARAREQRITDLEAALKLTTDERNHARENMEGFNDREEELYRKLRENERVRRDLHSRVMQLMGNIRVYVRVRPPLPGEIEKEQARLAEKNAADSKKRKRDDDDEQPFRYPGIYDRDDKKAAPTQSADDLSKNLIEVIEPRQDRGGLSERRKKWRFGFDNVFSPEHGQDDVWEATEPLVQSAIDGFNVTIFAYGQTGSGKTYTMLGEEGNAGIIARAVNRLFETKREMESLSRGETQVALSVELLEVYNEQVRDLLVPNSGALKVTSKEVVGNVVVATSSEEEVMHVLALAQNRRCVKATSSNSESSRSHMLFTIHFNVTMKGGIQRSGKLNVCDLAGSERLNKSGAHNVGGALLKETKNINTSLSVLSNVIECLQSGKANVPFRESKLTFLLQNSLGGNSKTLAIVCCNPLPSHFHESLCSLRFAEKVNKVDLKAVANFSC